MLAAFDLDGTLLDSKLDVAEAHSRAVRSACGVFIPKEDFFGLIGYSLIDTYQITLPANMKHMAAKAAEEYKKFYYDNCANKTKPFPNAAEALAFLKENGFKIAVATMKKSFMADRAMELAGAELLPYVDIVQGTDDFPGKPDPAIMNVVFARLGLEPTPENVRKTVYVGDTSKDGKLAKNFGCLSAAALYGYGDLEELAALSPDISGFDLLDLAKSIVEAAA